MTLPHLDAPASDVVLGGVPERAIDGAFLMPVASIRFLRARRYDRAAAIGLALGGIPGVLLAAFLVKSLPLDAVRLLVVIVIGYTAAALWPRRAWRSSAVTL